MKFDNIFESFMKKSNIPVTSDISDSIALTDGEITVMKAKGAEELDQLKNKEYGTWKFEFTKELPYIDNKGYYDKVDRTKAPRQIKRTMRIFKVPKDTKEIMYYAVFDDERDGRADTNENMIAKSIPFSGTEDLEILRLFVDQMLFDKELTIEDMEEQDTNTEPEEDNETPEQQPEEESNEQSRLK